MVECAEKTGASIVVGRVTTDFRRFLPPIVTATINLGSGLLRAPACNVMYCKSAIEEVGGFDREFGRAEDYDLFLRVVGRGHKAAFCWDAVVFHELDNVGIAGLWNLSSWHQYYPLLFKRHPQWTKRYLRVRARITMQTMSLGSVVLSALLGPTLSSLLNIRALLFLPILAFAMYMMAYVRIMIPKGCNNNPSRIMAGALAMLVFSLFAMIWKARGSFRYRTLLL